MNYDKVTFKDGSQALVMGFYITPNGTVNYLLLSHFNPALTQEENLVEHGFYMTEKEIKQNEYRETHS